MTVRLVKFDTFKKKEFRESGKIKALERNEEYE